MKKFILIILIVLFAFTAYSQPKLFQNIDTTINDIILVKKIIQRYQNGMAIIEKDNDSFKIFSKQYDTETGIEVDPEIYILTIEDLERIKTNLLNYITILDQVITKLKTVE